MDYRLDYGLVYGLNVCMHAMQLQINWCDVEYKAKYSRTIDMNGPVVVILKPMAQTISE